MDNTIIAAIIAAAIAALTSIANILLTVHRNKQDGITTYRMQWINDVRNEFTKILSWDFYKDADGQMVQRPIDDLKESVYKVSLFLNMKDEYDQQVLRKTFELLKYAQKTYGTITMANTMGKEENKMILIFQANEANQRLQKVKDELHKLIRVYLKTEWTRVKVESTINKFQYFYCWKPFCGFQANKATKKFLNEYKDWRSQPTSEESSSKEKTE